MTCSGRNAQFCYTDHPEFSWGGRYLWHSTCVDLFINHSRQIYRQDTFKGTILIDHQRIRASLLVICSHGWLHPASTDRCANDTIRRPTWGRRCSDGRLTSHGWEVGEIEAPDVVERLKGLSVAGSSGLSAWFTELDS